MEETSIQQFIDLITATLGLRVRPQDEGGLHRQLLHRSRALGLPSLEAYYSRLKLGSQAAMQDVEWRSLINSLTVNESYFFRDQGQFLVLKSVILPELIQRKQNNVHTTKTLSVWSAGCSTGEEAYSLAILLEELVSPEQNLQISVTGTDIDADAIDRAKQGIYSDWSFRLVQPELQSKYFCRTSQGWGVSPQIRCMVQFELENLLPNRDSPDRQQIDLILCRNVFIYFNADAIAAVLERFYRSLSPGGYLITGHTELHQQEIQKFQVRTFPESAVYQKQSLLKSPPTKRHLSQQVSLPEKSLGGLTSSLPANESVLRSFTTSPQADIDRQTELIERKHYTPAIPPAITPAIQSTQHHPTQQTECAQTHYLTAEAHANLGNHSQAAQRCDRAIQLDPLAIAPLYLMATIQQEQGNLEAAKVWLKRVIFLAPSSAYAYFELGCLYEQQGDLSKAQRNWRSALRELALLSPQAIVHKEITAAELQTAVETAIKHKVDKTQVDKTR